MRQVEVEPQRLMDGLSVCVCVCVCVCVLMFPCYFHAFVFHDVVTVQCNLMNSVFICWLCYFSEWRTGVRLQGLEMFTTDS